MIARWQHLPVAAQRVMPWQNGGGTTRQVAVDPPEGSLATGFRWRVSVAQVGQGGPFSRLPGVDRSLWLVRGRGMRLALPDREIALDRPFARFDFAGETPIEAALLDGPCEDCNVMTRRGEVEVDARIEQLAPGAPIEVASAPQRLVLALEGLIGATGPACAISCGDALLLEGGDDVAVTARTEAAVLVARFWPRRG